jgi:hypothetical protein
LALLLLPTATMEGSVLYVDANTQLFLPCSSVQVRVRTVASAA